MSAPAPAKTVEAFRQILFWPLRLMPVPSGAQIHEHWKLLEQAGSECPWQPEDEAFIPDPTQFRERHYIEFITFLPYVQRLLYGEGTSPTAAGVPSPIRVFRRRDVAEAELTFPGDDSVLRLAVTRCELFFFYDLDIVILVLEIDGETLTLQRAQEVLFRFGRAYPHFWSADGRPSNCLKRSPGSTPMAPNWPSPTTRTADRYLSFVSTHRAPCIAAHWEFLLEPLVPHYASEAGRAAGSSARIPSYAVDGLPRRRRHAEADPRRFRPPRAGDAAQRFRRLCPTPAATWKISNDASATTGFTAAATATSSDTRIICCGHAFIIVGNSRDPFFGNTETGMAAQFDHPYFVLGLVAHMHKAALLMLRDRLNGAVAQLNIGNVESVKQFKRSIRHTMEIFLRFTHRYWFQEISIQVQARDLFHMWRHHLSTAELHAEVRQEVLRHEQLPGQRRAAPSGRYRAPADRRHRVRADRHLCLRHPGHEHLRRDQPSAVGQVR